MIQISFFFSYRKGGDVVSNAIYSTVLVAPQFGRTCKMLSAFAKGIPIVSTKWVTDSYKARKFLDPENYLINVSEAEKRFKFKLKKSLGKNIHFISILIMSEHQNDQFYMVFFIPTERARAAGVFKGFSFYVTPNTKPSPQELSGKYLLLILFFFLISFKFSAFYNFVSFVCRNN